MRLLTTEEAVHRLSLQPPCVQLGVAARVKAVGLHVQPQDRGFTQSAYGWVHRARRGPGVERRSLKVGVHAQSGFVKVPLALASVPAVDLGLELVQPKHTWLGAGGSIGHDSLLRGAPRASYSLQPGSGAPGRYHRGEAQRSPPPRRARGCGRWQGALRCSPEPRNLPKRASHVLRGRGASWSLVGGPMPRADGTSGYAERRPGSRPAKTKS